MAPYDFQGPDAGAILRSSDGTELYVHILILGLASPVFRGMFSLPQPIEPAPYPIPVVDVSEPSDILKPFIQYFYPSSPPTVSDVAMWADLYTIADKYNAEAVMEFLRDMLIPRFLETSPFRVYALASRWGLEEEAKIASERTLAFDIIEAFPQGDAELMGATACQKLYHLHIQSRDEARALVSARDYRFKEIRNCGCPPSDPRSIAQALSERVFTKPRLPAEQLYEEVARLEGRRKCAGGCRNSLSFKNAHAWISLILQDLQEVPQTT